MAGTLDSAIERKKDQDVDQAAKQEQKRLAQQDDGLNHESVADDDEKTMPGTPRDKR